MKSRNWHTTSLIMKMVLDTGLQMKLKNMDIIQLQIIFSLAILYGFCIWKYFENQLMVI